MDRIHDQARARQGGEKDQRPVEKADQKDCSHDSTRHKNDPHILGVVKGEATGRSRTLNPPPRKNPAIAMASSRTKTASSAPRSPKPIATAHITSSDWFGSKWGAISAPTTKPITATESQNSLRLAVRSRHTPAIRKNNRVIRLIWVVHFLGNVNPPFTPGFHREYRIHRSFRLYFRFALHARA